MTSQGNIDRFLAGRTLAVVGVSGKRRGFGYTVYHDLKSKGYKVFAVNPNARHIDDDICYPDIASLPEKVDGVIMVVPPLRTEQVVRDVAAAGIDRVWMQQGAESKAAVAFCEEHRIDVVYGQCIMMFAGPVGLPHRMHRWVKKMTGSMPK